jgi:hypothetical protein
MGIIKGPKAHALAVHDENNSQNSKSKSKGKGKTHAKPKKDGYSKPFNDFSGSKGGKSKQGKKCGYCNRGNHLESTCMKKQIDLMAQILEKNNLGDFIPEVSKKKSKDQALKKGNPHALLAIHSSPDTWIVDSRTSHHMATIKDILSSVTACTGPPILMGDDSPIKVTRKGRVELDHESFENVLHVTQLSMNLVLVYQITHSVLGKKVEFTPDFVSIFDM